MSSKSYNGITAAIFACVSDMSSPIRSPGLHPWRPSRGKTKYRGP